HNNHQAQQPTVWIVHANDQHRAREILRKVGLLDSTRHDLSHTNDGLTSPITATAPPTVRWAWRIRLTLLLMISAIALTSVLHHRSTPMTTPQTPIAKQQPTKPQNEEVVRVRIQPAH
ncbi:MAG TPA: pathogenicity, partial [Xylella sp.]